MKAFTDFFTIVYDYSFAIQLITVSFSVVFLMREFERSWRGALICLAHISVVFVAETAVNLAMFVASASLRGMQGINFPLSHFIIVVIYTAFLCRYPVRNRLVLASTIFASAILLNELGAQIMRLASVGGGMHEFLTIPAYLLIIAFTLLMKKLSLNEYYEVPIYSAVIVVVINVAAMVVEFSNLLLFGAVMGDKFFCFALSMMFVVCVAGYLLVYFHCRERDENTRLQIENKLLESDKMMLQLSDKAVEEMHELRHDIRNQYMVMDVMLSEGRYAELKEYFESMKSGFSKDAARVSTGNHVIDSVINMEVLKATANNVAINHRINVPSELGIEASDLCRILSNLIDNAIEGVLRTDLNEFEVDCIIEARSEYLYICVQNAINADENTQKLLRLNTVKTDYKNHGYGHKIIKRIVEKYKGHIKYSVEDGFFIAEAILEIKTGD